MVATARAPTPVRAKRSAEHDFASEFFRTLNSVVEPVVSAGCFSPNLFAPTGLIVLETTGRRSGKPHRTPVLAMLMDGHLIVRTFRGERSHWFQNLRANPAFLPVRLEAYEESAAAYPLLQGERVGGCLLVATAQRDFFTPARLQLVNAYADLAVLALRDDQFYEKQAIQLRTMPATDMQQAHFASFRSRVNELINAPDRQVATIVQAEELVWSHLAVELMSLNP